MKKSFNSLALLAMASAAMMSSCSKDTDLYDASLAQKEYEQNWTEVFGQVASDQDWNLATRATANVNLDGTYDVKIYTANPISSESYLMAHYTVDGTKTFSFDAPKTLSSVFVTAEDAKGNLAVNSYVSLSNGIVNIDNTTRALTRTDESCPVTLGNAISISKTIYNALGPIGSSGYQEWNTLVEATFVPLENQTVTYNQTWKINDLLPIVGKSGVFNEKADNKKKYIPSELSKDVVYTTKGGPITLTYIYGGTDRYNKLAYSYASTQSGLKSATKYVLIDDARPQSNVFYKEVNGVPTSGGTTTDGMKWPAVIEDVEESRNTGVVGDDYVVGSTYKLVYVDPETGATSYDFPAGLKLCLFFASAQQDESGCSWNHQISNEAYSNNNNGGGYLIYSSISSDNEYYGQREWDENIYNNVSKTYIAAVTYKYGNNVMLGFEDSGDSDLNDILFNLNGIDDSNIPNFHEEEDTPQSWIIACEDLGGSEDVDFNDVVVKVSYVAGQDGLKVTPLAAGGVLKSVISFPSLGWSNKEIHELLNPSLVGTASGSYPMLNTSGSGLVVDTNALEYNASEITLGTGSDGFTLTNSEGAGNMGGFEILVDDENGAQTTIKAPEVGSIPKMIVVPATWAWPTERTHIYTAYPGFETWVGNASNYNWIAGAE